MYGSSYNPYSSQRVSGSSSYRYPSTSSLARSPSISQLGSSMASLRSPFSSSSGSLARDFTQSMGSLSSLGDSGYSRSSSPARVRSIHGSAKNRSRHSPSSLSRGLKPSFSSGNLVSLPQTVSDYYQPSSIASNLTSGSTPTLHVRSRSASRQPYTRDREDVKDVSAPQREPLTVQSQQSQPKPQQQPQVQLQQPEQPKDYKKLYEELLVEMENLRKECSRKEQEWNREKRQLQRKISELEEEVKQLETLKSDNQRLKDENGALIRVISKLSK